MSSSATRSCYDCGRLAFIGCFFLVFLLPLGIVGIETRCRFGVGSLTLHERIGVRFIRVGNSDTSVDSSTLHSAQSLLSDNAERLAHSMR